MLHLLIGACWLPVVWLQIRLRRLALQAERDGGALPLRYFTYSGWWFVLGWPAFTAVIGIFYLMVFKPQL